MYCILLNCVDDLKIGKRWLYAVEKTDVEMYSRITVALVWSFSFFEFPSLSTIGAYKFGNIVILRTLKAFALVLCDVARAGLIRTWLF